MANTASDQIVKFAWIGEGGIRQQLWTSQAHVTNERSVDIWWKKRLLLLLPRILCTYRIYIILALFPAEYLGMRLVYQVGMTLSMVIITVSRVYSVAVWQDISE